MKFKHEKWLRSYIESKAEPGAKIENKFQQQNFEKV